MGKQNKYKELVGLPHHERILRQIELAKIYSKKSRKSKSSAVNSDQNQLNILKHRKRKAKESQDIHNFDDGQHKKRKKRKADVEENQEHELDFIPNDSGSTEKPRKKKKRAEPVEIHHDKDRETPKSAVMKKDELKSKIDEKLSGARFRYINELLYTSTGTEASDLFANDRQLFDDYHEGYQSQKLKWPYDPLNNIIRQCKGISSKFIIADMGCGDARLAASIKQNVHSFDLVAVNERVTTADIARVPLPDESVDVCIFCLSLMGTNLADYIAEANRILKKDGIMKVVEIRSRFESIGKSKRAVERLGFQLHKHVNLPDDYFIQMDFKKIATAKKLKSIDFHLKPCLYKKR